MTSNESVPELRYGDRVASPTRGEGTIVGGRSGGLARVCFDRDKIERDWAWADLSLLSASTATPESISGPPPCEGKTNPAVGWNVAVIVVGVLIAFIGLTVGLTADPENSAFGQTVKALWVIQGLIGLLIAAIGILGVTIASTLQKDRS
jgi:hypothetical protein